MVYLLHFSRSFRHARHYIGVADSSFCAPARTLADDEIPNVPIVQAAAKSGVKFTIVRTWAGGSAEASKLRNQSDNARKCTLCGDVRVALGDRLPSNFGEPGTDNDATGDGQRASLSGARRKVVYRTVGKHGNSLMLCVPGVFAYALRVFRGAAMRLELDDDNEGFHVRVVERGRIYPSPPGNVRGVAEVAP